jgi:hypothetical protein
MVYFLTLFNRKDFLIMTLWDELYFEITLKGAKSDIKKVVSFLESGELDDFFEMSEEYIIFDDSYSSADNETETEMIFTNDDYGIEIDSLDADEFLELFCKAAKNLDVYGTLSDIDGAEFKFESEKGNASYINSRHAMRFNDELDEVMLDEERLGDDE